MIQTFNPASLSSHRIELFNHDESGEQLENLRETISEQNGQFISLNVAAPLMEPLPEMFYNALKNVRWDASLQFSLPMIVLHNPHIMPPFMNRAILWQRLCDLLILDAEPNRETVLVLENIDLASPETQHDVTRLIRFHNAHNIRRSFVFTVNRYGNGQMVPELRALETQKQTMRSDRNESRD